MGEVNRRICDRCGKEISNNVCPYVKLKTRKRHVKIEKLPFRVKRTESWGYDGFENQYDLCPECNRKFDQFIKGEKEDEGTDC